MQSHPRMQIAHGQLLVDFFGDGAESDGEHPFIENAVLEQLQVSRKLIIP